MNVFAAQWEKIVLGAVILVALIVAAVVLLAGRPLPTFSEQRQVASLGTNIADVYTAIIAAAEKPAPPQLTHNVFTHPWLQYCTNCKKLQPRWTVVCPECGARVNYDEDADGDGIPNAWEMEHGLNWTDPSDAALDPDGDGLTNLEEYKRGSNPNDPADPNIVLDEYRFVQIYRPVRPILFKNLPPSGNRMQIIYKNRSVFAAPNDEIKDGTKPVYRVGAVTRKKGQVWNPRLNATQDVDRSEVAMTDLLNNEAFSMVLGETNYEHYVLATIITKSSNAETNLSVGAVLPLTTSKQTATLVMLDETNKTWACTVGTIRYSGAAER